MVSLPAEVTYCPNTVEPQVLAYVYNENSFQIQLCKEQSMGIRYKEEMQMALLFSSLPLVFHIPCCPKEEWRNSIELKHNKETMEKKVISPGLVQY